MRVAGTIHARPAASISSDVGSRTSADRGLTAGVDLDVCTVSSAAATARCGGHRRLPSSPWYSRRRARPLAANARKACMTCAYMRWFSASMLGLSLLSSGVSAQSTQLHEHDHPDMFATARK